MKKKTYLPPNTSIHHLTPNMLLAGSGEDIVSVNNTKGNGSVLSKVLGDEWDE